MKSTKLLLLASSLILGAATSHAHRSWILPGATVLSGEDQWVSFDAAVSNNIFFANHRGIDPERVQAIAPDGTPVELQNATGGKIRGSFEINLTQQGTYVVSLKPGGPRRQMGGGQGDQASLNGTYEEDGKPQRWRGTPETLVSENMAARPGFKLRESGGRTVVTFVTLGSPSTENIKPTGKGLEVDYVTHPNDLFSGEPATFRFLIDGHPAANTEVALVQDGDRFRNDAGETILKTDTEGVAKIEWPAAGRYWLEASYAATGELHGVPSEKSYVYVTTLEVLPE